MMKVVIIGATGATGSALLDLLLASADVGSVVSLGRRETGKAHPKLSEVIVDFDKTEEWSHHVSGDVACSCLGTTLRDAGGKKEQHKVDYEYQYAFARMARANQVPMLQLVSSSGANDKSAFFYPRMKGQLERAVALLGFNRLVVFRPGPLDRPDSNRGTEKAGVALIRFFNKLGLLRNMAPLPVGDLAALMLRYAIEAKEGHTVLEAGTILKETGRR